MEDLGQQDKKALDDGIATNQESRLINTGEESTGKFNEYGKKNRRSLKA